MVCWSIVCWVICRRFAETYLVEQKGRVQQRTPFKLNRARGSKRTECWGPNVGQRIQNDLIFLSVPVGLHTAATNIGKVLVNCEIVDVVVLLFLQKRPDGRVCEPYSCPPYNSTNIYYYWLILIECSVVHTFKKIMWCRECDCLQGAVVAPWLYCCVAWLTLCFLCTRTNRSRVLDCRGVLALRMNSI